tara:strand:- start:3568 stop:5043 length:1476 start_codon:yes stop_codon:yes gene_type:complete
MANIRVWLKDYSMMYVDCDTHIQHELSDYFSFFVPGYKYVPAYKNKKWDGKIRLFNRLTGEINSGLYAYMTKFTTERGYEMIVERTDYGVPLDTVKIDDFDAFLKDAELPFMPRDYQYDALTKALSRKQSILLSPTGSGKSFIIYLLMQYILNKPSKMGKVLIIVPTTSLVEQLYSDFEEYGMVASDHIHKIYSGKDKITDKRVILSTWQSIYKLPKKWFEQFSMVIGDECHGFKSKSLSSIMNKSTEAEYRFGLTGTLDGTQTHRLVLEGLFGPVYKVTTTKALQDNNTLAPLDITIGVLQYPKHLKYENKNNTYQEEIDFLISNDGRNKFIRNLALSMKGNTLVLYNRVDDHGKPLFEAIYDKADENRKVFFVSGKVATNDREEIRHMVEKQSDAIIVASLGTFSTGINIRNLHNIIFASPSKSQIKVLQSIGRGLRKSDNGETTQLFDIADDLSYESRKNYTLLHSIERVRIYEKEQFNYKMIKVDIK